MVSFATDHHHHHPAAGGGDAAAASTAAVQDEMERILRCAGIESAPIDPSSMDALRQLIIERRRNNQKREGNDNNNNGGEDSNNMKKMPPPSSASAAAASAAVVKSTASASPRFVSTMPATSVARKPTVSALKKDYDHQHNNHEDLHVSFSNNDSDDDDDDDQKLPPSSFTTTTAATTTTMAMMNHKMVAKKFEDKAPSPVDRSIMDQLEFQTNLLIDMQRRIEELHTKVERLEGQQQQPSSSSSSTATATRSYAFSKTTRVFRAGGLESPADNATAATTTPTPTVRSRNFGSNNDETQQAAAPVVVEEENQNIQEEEQRQEFWLLSFLFHPYRSIMNSKVVEIIKLYWTLSIEFGVRPFDGGLLFKLLFVVLVFSARLSRVKDRSISKFANTSYTTGDIRFYVSIVVMVLGFLYHTKYLQYTYQFVYQDNIPLRVLNGEHVQHLGPPPQPPVPNNDNNNDDGNNNNRVGGNNDDLPPNNNNINRQGGIGQVRGLVNNNNNNNNADENINNNNNGWRNTFLGGEIQPVADEQNPIIGGIQDAIYLIGSFFFSIFPMWHPEEPPQPPREQDEHEDDENDNDDIDGDAHNQIPRVQPPRDAMEPADDDE